MEELFDLIRQGIDVAYQYPEFFEIIIFGLSAIVLLHYATRLIVTFNPELVTWKSTGKADQRHSDTEGLFDIYEQVCFTAWYGGKHCRWIVYAKAVETESAGDLVAQIEAKQDNGQSVYKTKKTK